MAAVTGSDSAISVSTVTPHVEISMETSVTTRATPEGLGTAGAGQVIFQMVTVQVGTERHGGVSSANKNWVRMRLSSLEGIFKRWQRSS